jgi:hypothetical protein
MTLCLHKFWIYSINTVTFLVERRLSPPSSWDDFLPETPDGLPRLLILKRRDHSVLGTKGDGAQCTFVFLIDISQLL